MKVFVFIGPSAAAKSTLAKNTKKYLEQKGKRCQIMGLDDYYNNFSSLSLDERSLINFDDPENINHELFVQQVTDYVGGKKINKPQYDFATHAPLSSTEELDPEGIDYLVLEGIHLLYDERIRKLSDITVFVKSPLEACKYRRVERDIVERGRDLDDVLFRYEAHVRPMYLQYVAPWQKWVDILVENPEVDFSYSPEELEFDLNEFFGHLEEKLNSLSSNRTSTAQIPEPLNRYQRKLSIFSKHSLSETTNRATNNHEDSLQPMRIRT